jgi:hypothetical protein
MYYRCSHCTGFREIGIEDFHENPWRNSRRGENGTKMSVTSHEDLISFIQLTAIRSISYFDKSAKEIHSCLPMTIIKHFILLKLHVCQQLYKVKALLLFMATIVTRTGYSVTSYVPGLCCWLLKLVVHFNVWCSVHSRTWLQLFHQLMHNYLFIIYTLPTCFDLFGHHQGI